MNFIGWITGKLPTLEIGIIFAIVLRIFSLHVLSYSLNNKLFSLGLLLAGPAGPGDQLLGSASR